MRFHYSTDMQRNFPERATGVLELNGVRPNAEVAEAVARLTGHALERLDADTESALPEIQAWRRAYSKMGLKPTQYRCASEALLRRLRKEGSLPRLHPLIDLCNATSVAYAVPVAVFDLDQIEGDLCVRKARGDERYLAFSDKIETPDPDEVIFADDAGFAHARRWANRQSRKSAVSRETTRALIVAEALHKNAAQDLQRLVEELEGMIGRVFEIQTVSDLLLLPDAAYTSNIYGRPQ